MKLHPLANTSFYQGLRPPVFSSEMSGATRQNAGQLLADLVGPARDRNRSIDHTVSLREIEILKQSISTLPEGTRVKILGSRLPEQSEYHSGGVVYPIPLGVPKGAQVEVCGLKGFIVFHLLEFEFPNGDKVLAEGGNRSVMQIERSPVHVHGITSEKYIPRTRVDKEAGAAYIAAASDAIKQLGIEPIGLMYVEKGDQFAVHALQAGEAMDLVPGLIHGWVGLGGATELLLDFDPGLVGKPTAQGLQLEEKVDRERCRDERIVHNDSLDLLAQIASAN